MPETYYPCHCPAVHARAWFRL